MLASRFWQLVSFADFADAFAWPCMQGGRTAIEKVNSGVNSIAAGRKLAARLVVWQCGASLVAAVVALMFGWRYGLAALGGGLAATAGTVVMGLRVFGPGLAGAGVVLARMYVGIVLKWGVIALLLYLVMVKASLPGPAVIIGLIAALVPQILGLHRVWISRR